MYLFLDACIEHDMQKHTLLSIARGTPTNSTNNTDSIDNTEKDSLIGTNQTAPNNQQSVIPQTDNTGVSSNKKEVCFSKN